MRWVFDEMFAAAGREFRGSRPACSRWIFWRATPGTSTPGSICLPTENARSTRSADFAGARKPTAIAPSAGDTKRIYDILEKPFLRAPQPSMGGLIGADGLRGLMRLPQIKPFSSMWSALGQYFARSAAAAIVRTLRHLLRLLAVSRAGNLDAGRACRARRRLEHRRRHARALPRRWRMAQRSFGATIRYGEEVSEVLISGGRAGGVRLASGERIAGGRRDRQRRRGGAARRIVRHRCSSRCRGHSAARPIVVGHDVERGREDRWLSAAPAQRVFLARLCSRIRRHLRARPAAATNRRSMSARRIATTTSGADAARNDCWSSSMRPPMATGTSYDAAEVEQCAQRTFGMLERCGLRIQPQAGSDASDDAGGFQPAVSGDGRRALRPQLARMDGIVPASGSANAEFRACIWRGAARIRVRACRWRRCRAARRRPACSRT